MFFSKKQNFDVKQENICRKIKDLFKQDILYYIFKVYCSDFISYDCSCSGEPCGP